MGPGPARAPDRLFFAADDPFSDARHEPLSWFDITSSWAGEWLLLGAQLFSARAHELHDIARDLEQQLLQSCLKYKPRETLGSSWRSTGACGLPGVNWSIPRRDPFAAAETWLPAPETEQWRKKPCDFETC